MTGSLSSPSSDGGFASGGRFASGGFASGGRFAFDGREVPFVAGQTVGAALAADGVRALRSTRSGGTPRGLFCGIGVCFDCLVVVNGSPDERACVTPAVAGLDVRTQHGQPPLAPRPTPSDPPTAPSDPPIAPSDLSGEDHSNPNLARGHPLTDYPSVGAPVPTGGELVADVIIVGGGPAGMAAAVAAVDGGASVVLLDAEARPGGQYWRHGPRGPGVHHHDLREWRRLSGGFDAAIAGGRLAYLPRHRVWRIDAQPLTVHAVRADEPQAGAATSKDAGRAAGLTAGQDAGQAAEPTAGHDAEPAVRGGETALTVTGRAVVLAAGAHDRVLPFPGWDLPGVFTAGGAQALLKEHGVLAGRRVVVAGSGPFLLPLAGSLATAGASVLGVLEAGDGRGWARGWRAVAGVPGLLGDAATYAADLARHRVPVRLRRAVVAAHGSDRVEAVQVARLDAAGRVVAGSQQRIDCDAVAVGWGFAPRLELAAQAGCALGASQAVAPGGGESDPAAGAAVRADVQGRSSVPGVFAAGELLGVGGAALAVVTGALAGAAAAAQALGAASAPDAALVARRRRLGAFAAAMHRAHAVPTGWTGWLDGDTTVCRCEEVPLARVHEAVDVLGATDARTAKLLTRCGMGWCQGRICGDAVSRIVAQRSGRSFDAVAESAAGANRPVAVPIRLSTLLAEETR